jgi:hypothetical protein
LVKICGGVRKSIENRSIKKNEKTLDTGKGEDAEDDIYFEKQIY